MKDKKRMEERAGCLEKSDQIMIMGMYFESVPLYWFFLMGI
jgi:hypothetical protein